MYEKLPYHVARAPEPPAALKSGLRLPASQGGRSSVVSELGSAVRGAGLVGREGPKGGCMMRKRVRSQLENSASGGRLGLDPKNDRKGSLEEF